MRVGGELIDDGNTNGQWNHPSGDLPGGMVVENLFVVAKPSRLGCRPAKLCYPRSWHGGGEPFCGEALRLGCLQRSRITTCASRRSFVTRDPGMVAANSFVAKPPDWFACSEAVLPHAQAGEALI